jgi:DNA topoisomerase-6 subunit A
MAKDGKKVGKRASANPELDQVTMQCIDRAATRVLDSIAKKKQPELRFPVRSLSNVDYDVKKGFFELGENLSTRTLTVNSVKTFAQTLKLMALSKQMVREDNWATKREAYYVSKNWREARFDEQPESDTVMDDVEAMFSLDGVTREQLRFIPDEHGGAVAGELTVIDRDPHTHEPIEIDCTKFGTGAYSIPSSVEHLKFRTNAKFVLAIETGGMFQRLQGNGYPQDAHCIIVSMAGVPTRSTRRFLRRLTDDLDLPVYAFVDCDPYGIANIYRTLKVGSGNAAHINQFFCVPRARFLGVTPQDIIDFKLQDATHPLQEVDEKRARDALKNDPFFKKNKAWVKAFEQMLTMKVRAEQQALTKWGLNYVIDSYLPKKLKSPGTFLP